MSTKKSVKTTKNKTTKTKPTKASKKKTDTKTKCAKTCQKKHTVIDNISAPPEPKRQGFFASILSVFKNIMR